MAVAGQLAQRAGIGQRFEVAALERGAQRQILHAREGRRAARRDDALGGLLAQRLHHAQAEPQRGFIVGAAFERAVPVAGCRR